MLRFMLTRTPVKRLTRGVPVVALLTAVQVAKLAKRHLTKLTTTERRRLLALLAKARAGTGELGEHERDELGALVAKLEPRAFVGEAADRFSPVPVPRRLLYGSHVSQTVRTQRTGQDS
jgi:hypothetical protein